MAAPNFISKGTIDYSLTDTVSPAYPASIVAGDMLIYLALNYQGAGTIGTIGTPSGFTSLISQDLTDPSTVGNSKVFYKIATGSETGSISATRTGSTGSNYSFVAQIYQYRGAVSVEDSQSDNGDTSTINYASLTVGGSLRTLVGLLANKDSAGGSTPSTYTQQATDTLDDAVVSLECYDKEDVSSDGAVTGGSGSSLGWVSFHISLTSNTAPTIDDDEFTIDENSAVDTSVGTVSASDPEMDTLTYSITAGNSLGAFQIDSGTGEITVADSDPLDFETNPVFILTVQVSDGEFTDTASITINISDINDAPTIEDDVFEINELSPVDTSVGTVSASDDDEDTLTYSIVSGNSLGAFQINSSTGEITVLDKTPLVFTTNPTFSLGVQVSDGTLTGTATITVNLIYTTVIAESNPEYYKIPNNYRQSERKMRPAYLQDFPHFFYVNLDEVIEDSDFDDWTFSLWQGNTEILASIGTLTKDVISGDSYRCYVSFTLSAVDVPTGEYYFVIYNTSTNVLIYQGNCFRVINSTEVEDWCLIEFRNSSDVFNFNYDTVTTYNSIFLPLNLVEQQPEVEIKRSMAQTTGIRRNQRVVVSKVLSVEAMFFDDEANDAMLALSAHDDIKINGRVMTVKEAYKIQPNRFNSLQKGVIELYDQQFSTINYSQ